MLLRRYHKKAVEAVEEKAAVEAVEEKAAVEAVEEKAAVEAVEEMTVAELKAYAAANNIDLGEATKKADILAAIKNA